MNASDLHSFKLLLRRYTRALQRAKAAPQDSGYAREQQFAGERRRRKAVARHAQFELMEFVKRCEFSRNSQP